MTRIKELPNIQDKELKKVKSRLTQEDVKELFEYRDGDLYWKIDIYGGRGSLRIKSGTKAGCIHNVGTFSYKVVNYQYKKYKISRLIFLMFHGYLPENVTYKDRNTLNTRVENLLEANESQVQSRSKLSINNKTGYRGVYFCKIMNKYGASIRINNKPIQLGYYDTPEEGSKAFKEARIKYYGTYLNKCEVSNG